MHNVRHKRQQHTLNTLRPLLKHNNSTIVKPDKSKAIVIINKYNLDQKIQSFIKENNIPPMNKDPTEKFQKQIRKAIA